MNGKIQPDKKDDTIKGYAGTPPFKTDLMIFWLIYFLSISTIRETYSLNYIMEILYTLLWLFISDILASVCAFIIKAIFLKKKDYIGTQKSHKYNMNRLIWQYFLYCIFRSLGYAFGITAMLSVFFLTYVSVWYGFWAFLLAWMIVSIISKVLAFFFSAWITKTI